MLIIMKHQVIYAGAPWKYLWRTGKNDGHFAPEKHYQTMTTGEICTLKVRSSRDNKRALFLRAAMPALPDAFKIMEARGFKYKTYAFSWVKTKAAGDPLRGTGELHKAKH
jgi:N6-adenosine-specific RNA methylase IME4